MNAEMITEFTRPFGAGTTIYKPEDIRRWGIARFMQEIAPDKPLQIPDLGFTVIENKRMEALLNQEITGDDF